MSPVTILRRKRRRAKQDKRRDARDDNEIIRQNLDKGMSALEPLGSLAVLPIEVRSMIFGLFIPAAGSLRASHNPASTEEDPDDLPVQELPELLQLNLPVNNDLSALQQTCKAIHKEITSLPIYKSREYLLTITDCGILFEGVLSLVEHNYWGSCHDHFRASACTRKGLLFDSRAVQALRDTLHNIQRLRIKFQNRYTDIRYNSPPFCDMGRMCAESGIDEVIESAFKNGVVISTESEWVGRIAPRGVICSEMMIECGVVGGPLLKETYHRYCEGLEGVREIAAEEWGELYGKYCALHGLRIDCVSVAWGCLEVPGGARRCPVAPTSA